MNILADASMIPSMILFLLAAFLLILTILMPVYVCMIYYLIKKANAVQKDTFRQVVYIGQLLAAINANTQPLPSGKDLPL